MRPEANYPSDKESEIPEQMSEEGSIDAKLWEMEMLYLGEH